MIGDRIEVNIAGGLDIALPRMVHIRQKFKTTEARQRQPGGGASNSSGPKCAAKIKPGMTIAVGCGSRGIANIAECAKQVVAELKALGAKPFIFPAMGSHGGATAEGQREVLEGYGITESFVGCPIHSQMDVVELGKVDGMPVYMDKLAAAADGVVLDLPRQAAHQFPCAHRERHRQDDDHRHGQDHRRHRAAHQRHGYVRRAAAQGREVHHVQEELPVRRGDGGERRRRDRAHRGRAGRADCSSASRSCRPRPRR